MIVLSTLSTVIIPLLKKSVQTKATSKLSKSTAALPPYVRKNPPIPLICMMKKMDKVHGPDAEKSEWIKLEFLMDLDNPASKHS
jgi:hypothetical protein